MDRKLFNLVVFVDIKKPLILLTMRSYCKNYKTRTQRCEVNGCISGENDVKCGVPQGSVLGPLFFLLYINDLPACLSKTRLFANDTNITAAGECLRLLHTMNVRFSLLDIAQRILGVTLPNFQ